MKNSLKKIIAIVGIVVFIFSLYFVFNLRKNQSKALNLDKKKTGFGIISGEFLPCVWEAGISERVITANSSQAVLITVKNSSQEKCQSVLTLQAPGFDISPYKNEQQIILPPKSKGTISWILTPRKSGIFQITITDLINTKILGITITDLFGLTAGQTKVLSTLGSLFGPMFTIPWWWDRLRKRREK